MCCVLVAVAAVVSEHQQLWLAAAVAVAVSLSKRFI